MDINGTTIGSHARRYPSYCYKVPVYPRFTLYEGERIGGSEDYLRVPETQDALDYSFRVVYEQDGILSFQFWLMPNECTEAKEERKVYEAKRYGWPQATRTETEHFFAKTTRAIFPELRHGKDRELRCSS